MIPIIAIILKVIDFTFEENIIIALKNIIMSTKYNNLLKKFQVPKNNIFKLQ